MVFRNAQMLLKQEFTNLVKQAFNVIHNPSKIEKYLMMQPLYKDIDDKEVARAVNTVQVRIAGTPPESLLRELLTMGVLKPEAYVGYIHIMHNIPMDDLNEKPTMSLTDIMTEGKETLQDQKIKSDEKKQKRELDQREKDGEIQESNTKQQIQLEKTKQQGLDGKIEFEKVKQKGQAARAKQKPKAKKKR
jgi:hypothetical protein